MLIFPAIDLRGGCVVRLTQGDYAQMTVYSDEPISVAEGFKQMGAKCLHVVDLDGAKDGSPKNREVIARLCSLGLEVEVGGGMRDERSVENTLALGASRVILGTLAVTDFPLVVSLAKRYGEKIAVGVDARDGMAATHGWLETSGISGFDFCLRLRDSGISTVIYTDISRDGRLSGANLSVYKELRAIDGLNVIASGGVTEESEIAELRGMGLYGAILGKALYAGRLTLENALSAARGERA